MMKRILPLFFLVALSFFTEAQLSFVRADTVPVIDDVSPLKNAWAGGFNYPQFREIDLNGDGVMDLVVYEPGGLPGHDRLMPFINHGDSGKVDYHDAPEYIKRFPDINAWLVTFDYNCDGKKDLFCLSQDCSCGIMTYRNDYTTGGGLSFTKMLNDSGRDYLQAFFGNKELNIPANSVSVPEIMDIDGDGDMDVMGWKVFGTTTLAYYRGIQTDNGWSCDSLRFRWDNDCWAHFALNSGSNSAVLGISCRESLPDTNMHWDTGNTLHDDTQSCICIYNQDNNPAKDLLVGGYQDANVLYLHNGGTQTSDNMDYQDNWPSYATPDSLNSFPCAYYLDVDNDGKKDMIISPHSVNDFRGIQFYKGVGPPGDTPVFALQQQVFLQNEMIEVGTASSPQIFDYDCDGLPDLLVGNNHYHDTTGVDKKGIALYKNTGTASSPQFQLVDRDFAGLNSLNGLNGTFAPTFGDIDGDGDPDMIVGSNDGKLYFFRNTAGPCAAATYTPPSGNYMGIDVGQYSTPQLYDLDHDGVLDLIIGNSAGFIKYFKNTGTASAPAFSPFATKDTLGGIMTAPPGFVSGFAAPVFYNDSGVDKLLVGTYNGKLYSYDNITGNIFGNYHLVDSILNGEEGQNIAPTIGDINNDGRPDLIVGNFNGGLGLYMNGFGVGINEAHKAPLPGLYVYPNPANEEIAVDLYNINKQDVLEITNILGQSIYREKVNERRKIRIACNYFPNGIYIVRLLSSRTVPFVKLVVNH